MLFAAGTISVRVQVKPRFWLWVRGPEQGAEGSALPGKRSPREEQSTQPAAGLSHSAGTKHTHLPQSCYVTLHSQ